MTVQCYVTVADPDFDLRRGLGSILLAQPDSLPLVISSFSTQIRVRGGGRKGEEGAGPSPRSATVLR